jgi:hypothetical protein
MFDEENLLMNDVNHHKMLRLAIYQTSTIILIDALRKELKILDCYAIILRLW